MTKKKRILVGFTLGLARAAAYLPGFGGRSRYRVRLGRGRNLPSWT